MLGLNRSLICMHVLCDLWVGFSEGYNGGYN
jgi:hypothetical protein